MKKPAATYAHPEGKSVARKSEKNHLTKKAGEELLGVSAVR